MESFGDLKECRRQSLRVPCTAPQGGSVSSLLLGSVLSDPVPGARTLRGSGADVGVITAALHPTKLVTVEEWDMQAPVCWLAGPTRRVCMPVPVCPGCVLKDVPVQALAYRCTKELCLFAAAEPPLPMPVHAQLGPLPCTAQTLLVTKSNTAIIIIVALALVVSTCIVCVAVSHHATSMPRQACPHDHAACASTPPIRMHAACSQVRGHCCR